MGKLRRSYRKAIAQLKFAVVAIVVIAATILQIAASAYRQYLWLIPASAFLFFFFKLLRRFLFTPAKYINENGYVVLSESNELEHRHIAKNLLGRSLQENEIVHHINGKKTDNQVQNLCLMDREKHELFHSWLSWKKNKTGRYPAFVDQKRLLEEEYGGTLLENIRPAEKKIVAALQVKSSESNVSAVKRLDADRSEHSQDVISRPVDTPNIVPRVASPNGYNHDPELQKKLFVELRNERKRLAEERNVPAYLVFHDKTLIAMSETMPDSKHAMSELIGMDKEKYETYGAQFIAVIRNFKSQLDSNQKNKKDPA